MPGTVEMRSAV